MGKIVKILFILLIIFAAGYYLDQKGIIDIQTEFNITTENSKVWTNENISEATSDPRNHIGEKVELSAYIFNSINVSTSSGTVTGYEAYLGDQQMLERDHYNTTNRVLITFPSTAPNMDSCIHFTGTIKGIASITTGDGSQISVTYIEASQYQPVSMCR